jgi:hypothetical protein
VSEEYKDIETVKHSFVVRDDDKTEFTAIRIDEGKFKGVIYGYNEVQVGKETDSGGLNLHFTVIHCKSENDNHIEFEEEFHNVCGDILVSCMEKGIRKEDEVDIIYRDSDSESFADERELYKESLTISEE